MMKIAKGALSMLLSIVLVVGLFPNLAYAVGPASAKSEEQGPARPAPEVPVTEELVVPTSGNVSFELAEDNSLSKQASAGASRLKAVFGSSRMRALVADAVEGASSEAASDAAEGEADAGVAEQPLVLSTPDEVGSLRSGGDAEERVMDGMSAMDEAPSRAPTATSGGYSYRQVSGGVEVTGYSGAGGDIVVPDVLDGSPVVGIAARAFMNNASLSSVVLPASVSKVGDRAFSGCASLSSVTLAEGLKYLGAEAFSGCAVSSVLVPASLEDTAGRLRAVPGPFAGCPLSSASLAPGSVRVAPGLFSGCSALASVGVPSSVASYGERCFQGCASLASFEVPEDVSEVGDHAFQGCTGLTAMELPSSVSKVGNYAFWGCASLSSVTLSEGLKYLGAEAFSGCAVSSVLIPASLEDTGGRYLGPGPFAGCPLASASLAPGASRVAPGLFAECASLASFEVPEGVSEIGSRAFADCSSLVSLRIPASVSKIGNGALKGCTALTVTCPRNSLALLYAVQNSVPVDIDDYSRALLDPAVCSYSFQRRADGLAALNLRYGFAPAAPAVSVESAEVLLPASSAVREVLVDGTPAIWSFSGGKLSISVKKFSASIEALCELPAGTGSASCASVVFKRDGAQGFEVVDFLSSVGSPITLRAPEVTASGSFTVRGRATAGMEVSLSVGGAVVGAATASQTGSYSAEVSIPSPERRREYAVAASCPDGAGGTVSASVPVLYDPGQAGVTRFVMRYGGKEHDLLGGGPLQATFYPSWYQGEHPFTFEVAFDAPHENLEWVRVVSDKGGERKHLDLAWDEAVGCFSATGWFDPSDRDYVPGALSVSYGVKPEQHTVDLSDPASYDPAVTVPSSWSDVTVTREDVDANTVCYTYSSPTIFNDPDNPATITVKGVSSAIAVLEGFPRSVQEALDQDYEPLGFINLHLQGGAADSPSMVGGSLPTSDTDITRYMKTIKGPDGSMWISIVEFLGWVGFQSGYELTVSDSYVRTANNPLNREFLQATRVIRGVTAVTAVWSLRESWTKYDNLEKAVANSNLSPEDKAVCYERIRAGRVFSIIAAGLTIAGALTSSTPAGLALGILGLVYGFYVGLIDSSIEGMLGRSVGGTPFGWLVDPSGYACDALTGQRLAGARATLYFKASEDGEAEEWDASPYGQQNPLVTDGQGCFSWDVPEGWWQVRIEKEGYAPASSDWVRVPSEGEPDLSIPLVPLTAFSAGATFLPQSVAFAD